MKEYFKRRGVEARRHRDGALFIIHCSLFIASGCAASPAPAPSGAFALTEIRIGHHTNRDTFTGVLPGDTVVLTFSEKVATGSIAANIVLKQAGETKPVTVNHDQNPSLTIILAGLQAFAHYELIINTGLQSEAGAAIFTGKTFAITTGMDMTDKFPRITDEALLDLVQRQTFRYFWDFGHPTSGMARERTTTLNTVTTGGTGFGIMAILVAAERQYISRTDALQRIQTIVTFLDTRCTAYHGVYAHWLNGDTGATIPFSTNDNGGDLVETAFLMQGLLAARRYFDGAAGAETTLRSDITRLWEAVEWDWYRRDGQNVLYWHWSPDRGWAMNHRITGWNEALMVYLLAASSPTHPVPKVVYDEGWARSGAFTNGNPFYGYTLPLGNAFGGPLFFTHYSFLGLDPRNLSDRYANYFTQNRHHSLIHYHYCIENPKGYGGYSADCWGLTASDGNKGYSAHSPTNDRGVVAPTAALSSMPYTPDESMQALRFFYYKLGDKLWSEYGFYDAFNLSEGWFDNQHIAIDQGPIIVMIENHRTALLWNLFMSDPDIQAGLRALEIEY
ncbi:MAG: Ig-like domain-containing protein [Prevotellaceae bacterium]|nr:Ig-like domain-containing protein [Prevotellaceae bacterium]